MDLAFNDNIGATGITDGVQYARLDMISGSLEVIDYEHHEIHGGSSFSVSHYGTSKGDGDTINIYLKTPNTTKLCHVLFSWSSSGAAFGRIYEAPVITANTGTNGVAIFNRYRDSANASVVVDNATSPAANKVGIDVTKTGDGTILLVEYAGVAKSQGASHRGDSEFILKANTAYLFEVESDAAGLTLNSTIAWYEHTNKEQISFIQ
jgi:hypothetical protein